MEMMMYIDMIRRYAVLGFWLWLYSIPLLILAFILKCLYNLFLHPLRAYPGPLLWRASRLPYSYHQARGDLFFYITAHHVKYGRTVRLAPDELSFTGSKAWQDIFASQSGTGQSKSQLQKAKHFYFQGDPKTFPDSILTVGDAQHARIRRQIAPAFTGRAMEEIEPVLQEYTDLLISQLSATGAEADPLDIGRFFSWTLIDVIGDLAFGIEFDNLKNQEYHEWPKFFLSALKTTAFANQFNRFGLGPLVLLLLPREQINALDFFINFSLETTKLRLEDERDEAKAEEKSNYRPDFVSLMLRELKNEKEPLNDAEIASNSTVLVVAGSETTTVLLSTIIYYLCKTAQVMDKLVKEIRTAFQSADEITIKGVMKLEYLQAVIEETLRIFPPNGVMPPRMTADSGTVIDGKWIPPHIAVSVAEWYNARSEDHFENAHSFRPERWLEKEGVSRPKVHVRESSHPFSLGPRNCVGKLLAHTETRLVMSKLLWNFDVELNGDHDRWIEDARFFVIWELKPLMVRLTPAIR